MRVAALFLLLAPAGCWLPAYTVASGASDWVDIPNVNRPPDEAVRTAREVLTRQGYRLAAGAPGELRLESEWDVHLSSHWRDGFRTKIEVRVDRMDNGRSLVRIRDFREFNDHGKSPMNPDAAQWVGASVEDKHRVKMGEPSMRVRQLLKVKLEGQP